MLSLETNVDLGKNSLAPIVNISQWDRDLAPFMKYLLYYVDPARAPANTPPLAMRDARSGLPIIGASSVGPNKTASDPLFNGRATLDFTDGADDNVRIKGSTPIDDITVIAVATRPATTGVLLSSSLLPGSTYTDIVRTIGSDTHLSYGAASNSSLESNMIPTAGLPSRDAPAVYMISYREAVKTSRWYVNDPATTKGEFVHPTPKSGGADRKNAEYCIGGIGTSGTLSWTAKVGEMFVFSVPMHLAEYDAPRTAFMAMLKSRYGIV
jgi:hypothetical protein